MNFCYRQKPIAHHRRGVTAVEVSIAAIILFLSILIGVEIGRLGTIRHSADNAAYDAARHVIVPGASVNEAKAHAQEFLSVAGIKNAVITVNPNPLREDTPQVKVDVEVPLSDNTWAVSMFRSSIGASCTLHTERPPLVLAKALPTVAAAKKSTTASTNPTEPNLRPKKPRPSSNPSPPRPREPRR